MISKKVTSSTDWIHLQKRLIQVENFDSKRREFKSFFCFVFSLQKVLARVCITLTDTVIRLEHLTDTIGHGVAVEVRIKQ